MAKRSLEESKGRTDKITNYQWVGFLWAMLILCIAVYFLVSCLIYAWEHIPKIEKPSGCFYDWQLSYQCEKQGGELMPVTAAGAGKQWQCNKNYAALWIVEAC